ncbi:MAG: hypothetical protein LLF92_02140 [Planctomycetaceae bacterium]|nr:hypothetical protein [Planctomycetaceae bacterium]
MKHTKVILALFVILLFSMTMAYAGDKKGKADKKCQAVKACKDVNDNNTVKQCAAKRKNMEKCKQDAASKGEKKGWFSSWFGQKDAKTSDKTCSSKCTKDCSKCPQKCTMKDKEKCETKCPAMQAKSMKNCKKAKACQKPADPNAPKTK